MASNRGRSETSSRFFSGHCAGTLWDLVDWLAKSQDPSTRTALAHAGLSSKDSIRDHVKAGSQDLSLCWAVTNNVKHFELEGYTLKESQVDEADLSAICSPPQNTPAYRFVPKIKTKAGDNLRAVQVYKNALTYWEGFFTRLGLS